MTRDEAERAALRVRDETGLSTTTHNDGDSYWVDIDLPIQGDEVKTTATLNELADWAWIGPTRVLPRLRNV